jgi:hypothetical protein
MKFIKIKYVLVGGFKKKSLKLKILDFFFMMNIGKK